MVNQSSFKDVLIPMPPNLTNNCNPNTFPSNIYKAWNIAQFKMQEM